MQLDPITGYGEDESEGKSGGSGAIIVVIILLVVLGSAGAGYYIMSKYVLRLAHLLDYLTLHFQLSLCLHANSLVASVRLAQPDADPLLSPSIHLRSQATEDEGGGYSSRQLSRRGWHR